MKTYLAKSDSEAQALHDGTQKVIVIPFAEQPPSWCKPYWPPQEGDKIVCVHHTGKAFTWKALYAPGDRIAVKHPRYDRRTVFWHVFCKTVACRQIQTVTEEEAGRYGFPLEEFDRFPSSFRIVPHEFAQRHALGNGYRLGFAWAHLDLWPTNPWCWFVEVE